METATIVQSVKSPDYSEGKTEETIDITPQRFEAFVKTCVAHRDNYWQYFPEPKGLIHIKEKLIDALIKEHLNGKTTLGLSPFLDNENALYIGFDIDIHGMTDGEKKDFLEANNNDEDALKDNNDGVKLQQKALTKKQLRGITELLKKEGFAFFINSSGSSGQHGHIYSNTPINAERGIMYLKYLFEDVLKIEAPEIFPKQNCLSEKTPYGNQMKGVLGIHPKHKKRANIMREDGSIMSLTDSLDFLIDFQNKLPSARQFPPADWQPTPEQKAKYTKKQFNAEGRKQDVPKFCAFIEKIACKKGIPSEGEYTKHHRIDGNVYQYAKHNNKPEILEEYSNMHGHGRETKENGELGGAYNGADDWVFSCGGLNDYIKHFPKDSVLKDCQGTCANCKYKQNEPPTLKKSLIFIYERIQKGGFKISLKDFNGRIKDYTTFFEQIKQAKNDTEAEKVFFERIGKTTVQKDIDTLYSFLEESKINFEEQQDDYDFKEKQKAQTEEQSNPETLAEYREKALEIMKSGDPIQYIRDIHKTLHVGDDWLTVTLIAAQGAQSVINSAGIQPKLSGKSGKGKSHCCKAFLHLIPKEYVFTTSLSDKALYHQNINAGTTIYSDDINLSEGLECVIKRGTTNFQEKTLHTTYNSKINQNETLEIPERIVWILTSVNDDQSMQLINRQFGGDVNETTEQDKDVFEFELKKGVSAEEELPETKEVLICREIIRELKQQLFRVSLKCIEQIEWNDKQNRRNFPMFQDMIRAFAAFRFKQRGIKDGILYADIEDYNLAEGLYNSRKEKQGYKLNAEELAVCNVLKDTELDIKELQERLKMSHTGLYYLLNGRPNKPESGLLSKMNGLTKEERTEKSDGKYIRKTYYSLTGFFGLAAFNRVVSLSDEAKKEFQKFKEETLSQPQ